MHYFIHNRSLVGQFTQNAAFNLCSRITSTLLLGLITFIGQTAANAQSSEQQTKSGSVETIDYDRDIVPIFRQHCAACHNDQEPEGMFSVSSYDSFSQGSDGVATIVPGNAEESWIIRLINGQQEPQMPPEGEPRVSENQLATLVKWIDSGAAGPSEDNAFKLQSMPTADKVATHQENTYQPTSASAACPIPNTSLVAVGDFQSVELVDLTTMNVVATWSGFAGKINQLRPSLDGRYLAVASGIAGMEGQASVIDLVSRQVVASMTGHTDILYTAAFSPDGKWLATGSYDRLAMVWDWRKGQAIGTLSGHNGAIYDLDIDPTGQVIATASADETVKLWKLDSGDRLDTLGQPEGEMTTVRFHPSGNFVAAAGRDRRIRLWELKSKTTASISPQREARFAHESPIISIRFSADGKWLLSSGEDKQVKLWSSDALRPIQEIATLADIPVTADFVQAFAQPQAAPFLAAFNGQIATKPIAWDSAEKTLDRLIAQATDVSQQSDWTIAALNAPAETSVKELLDNIITEQPVTTLQSPQSVTAPAVIIGLIGSIDSNSADNQWTTDEDYYKFSAKAGQAWVIEVKASRDKSLLDSHIEILHPDGSPVVRTRLQAIRESYFTFRGKDGDTSNDFRLHNWEEMELNDYLYSSGEVTRLWLYPRGPDSGFIVYPGSGKRETFFDTTPISHALGEPAYVVRPLAVDAQPLPNGLPTWDLYYENDDDSLRRWGSDSRLNFIAPADGDYLVRIRDARGFYGENYRYQLTIRQPSPDFSVRLNKQEFKLSPGENLSFSVSATREDGYDGPIEIQFRDLPLGYRITEPLAIEAGQNIAFGTISRLEQQQIVDQSQTNMDVMPDLVASPTDELATATEGESTKAESTKTEPAEFNIAVFAVANFGDRKIEHPVVKGIKIIPEATETAAKQPTFRIVAMTTEDSPNSQSGEPVRLTIRPGQTISARLIVDRRGVTGPISFGNEDSGRNLPHGVFVDNIGLNGLLIPDGQTEREFFITAASIASPQTRPFHLEMRAHGNPASNDVILEVVK